MSEHDMHSLVNAESPLSGIKKLPKGLRHTLEFMLNTLIKFPDIPSKVEEAVLGRIAEVLTFSVRETVGSTNTTKRLRKCLLFIMEHKRTKRKSYDRESGGMHE